MDENVTLEGRTSLPPDLAQTPVTRLHFGRRLARLRIAAGLTQGTLGEQIAGTRSTVAQWESGRNLPPVDTVRVLDELLDAEGELMAISHSVRETQRTRLRQRRPIQRPVDRDDQQRPNILQVFNDVGSALAKKLLRSGGNLGWRHELQDKEEDPTPLATAYGLKALIILRETGVTTTDWMSDGSRLNISEIEQWLLSVKRPFDTDGWGWSGGSHNANMLPTAQVTAGVFDALHRANPSLDAGSHMKQLEILVDKAGFTRSRPAMLCMVLDACLRMAPDSSLARTLVERLLDTRLDSGLWPEKRHRDLVRPLPSTAHTARAIWTLQQANVHIRERDKPKGLTSAIAVGVDWLANQHDLSSVSEFADRSDEIPMRHFTAAWVLRALIATDRFDAHGIACREAIDEIWKAYHPGEHLWILRNGEVPVWMTFDALESLRLLALATSHADSWPVPMRLAESA